MTVLFIVLPYLYNVGCVVVTAYSLEVEPNSRLKVFDSHTVLALPIHIQHIPPFGVQLLQ